MSAITIALSKGRIFDETLPLLATAGVSPSEDPETSRKLIIGSNRAEARFIIVRASDVPTYVQYGAADFVTSHNVLAHVDDLGATFANIHSLLKSDGLFCFEVGYFKEVLKNNFFDTIYHEHLDYHHAAPLVRHLSALGFSILDISVNPVQGGSIRVDSRENDGTTFTVHLPRPPS